MSKVQCRPTGVSEKCFLAYCRCIGIKINLYLQQDGESKRFANKISNDSSFTVLITLVDTIIYCQENRNEFLKAVI